VIAKDVELEMTTVLLKTISEQTAGYPKLKPEVGKRNSRAHE
jgi:hypothetical protein